MGGTFDPVHYGHLRIADRVRTALGLSELALLPTAVPPHKSQDGMSWVNHRVEMVRLALREFSGLALCDLELTEAVAYTVDTLRAIRENSPGTHPVFVVGMDSVAELHTWHDYRGLIEEFDLVAVGRPDHARSTLADCDSSVAACVREPVDPGDAIRLIPDEDLGRGGRIFPLVLPGEPISSREIRARAALGADLVPLVPVDVALYIRRHELYSKGVKP